MTLAGRMLYCVALRVAKRRRSKAFGEQRYTYGTTPTDYRYRGAKRSIPAGDTGQLSQIDAVGLYYYGARWYDSQLGRFTQPDTIIPQPGNPMAWDRYAYTLNNPVKYTDPTGHDTCNDDGDCWDRYGKSYKIHRNGRRSLSWHHLTPLQLRDYLQHQMPDSPSGCGPYSFAMAMNLQLGENIFTGSDVEDYFEREGYKIPDRGMPSTSFEYAGDSLYFNPSSLTFASDMTVDDLLDNLQQGNLSLAAVSWQTNSQILLSFIENSLGLDINSDGIVAGPTVGHYMVLTSYDADNDMLGFLDPGQNDNHIHWYARSDFERIWLKQPNAFMPSGGVIYLKGN